MQMKQYFSFLGQFEVEQVEKLPEGAQKLSSFKMGDDFTHEGTTISQFQADGKKYIEVYDSPKYGDDTTTVYLVVEQLTGPASPVDMGVSL